MLVIAVVLLLIVIFIILYCWRCKNKKTPEKSLSQSYNNLQEENTRLCNCIYYCQNDKGDRKFENFCKKLLPHGFLVNEIKVRQTIPRKFLLVVFLPIENRRNRVEDIAVTVRKITNEYNCKKNAEICLLLISHDGNLGATPLNVLDNGEFERVKNSVDCKLTWFINVTYSDDFNFTRTDVNVAAATELQRFAI